MTAAAQRAIEHCFRVGEQCFDLVEEDGNVVGACAPGWGSSNRAHTVGCREARHVSGVRGTASSEVALTKNVHCGDARTVVMSVLKWLEMREPAVE